MVLDLILNKRKTSLYVAKELGVGAQRILKILFDKGYYDYIPTIASPLKEKVIDLYKEKTPVNKIVKIVGEPKYKVTYTLKIAGFNPQTCFKTSREDKIDHHFFDIIDTEEKAYFLGFMFADGYICAEDTHKYQIELALQENDSYILEAFKKATDCTYKISRKEAITRSGFVSKIKRLTMYSKTLWHALNSKGCTTKKSQTEKFPAEDVIPRSLMHHFIRGYFDGDGSIFFNDKHVAGWNFQCSYDFGQGLQEELLTYSELKSFSFCKGHGDIYEIRTGGIPQCLRLQKYLYKDATIYLTRKYDKFKEIETYYANKNSRVTPKGVA